MSYVFITILAHCITLQLHYDTLPFLLVPYFIVLEITLMQRAMIQASHIMLTHVISLLLILILGFNNDITRYNYNLSHRQKFFV